MSQPNSLLKQAYWFLHDYSKGALSCKSKQSILKRIVAYTKGFRIDSMMVYNLDDYDLRQYVSDYTRKVKLPLINEQYSYVLDDKLVMERVLDNVIPSVACVFNGVLLSMQSREPVSLLDVFLLLNQSSLILKPRRGGGGYGIHKIRFADDTWMVNAEIVEYTMVSQLIKGMKDYLVYPCIEQKGFAHDVYPHSLNTIRVMSIMDPQSLKPVIIRALHRFGTKESGHVDNWSSGGICCNIDVENGVLGKGVMFSKDNKLRWHDSHPDTETKMENMVVPNWARVKEFVASAHKGIAYLPYVGWDVVQSGDNITLLEANSNSDVNLFQAHQPLLMNKDYVRFLKHYGILRG